MPPNPATFDGTDPMQSHVDGLMLLWCWECRRIFERPDWGSTAESFYQWCADVSSRAKAKGWIMKDDRPLCPHCAAMNAKRKVVINRIETLEKAIGRAMEYLESGKHADWRGFRPLFVRRVKDGKELPPHKEWVRNVFLPRVEKALSQAEKILERLG